MTINGDEISVNVHSPKTSVVEASINQPLTEKGQQAGSKKAKSTNLQASFTLFKVFVGSGILALPASFASVGFIPAFIGTIIVAILTYYGMVLLIKVMDSLDSDGSMSLQKLADTIMGRWARISVEISLILMQVGAAIAVLIFAKKFLIHVTCESHVDFLCNNNLMFAVIASVIVIPLSLINNMHYFFYPSLVATFFICVNVITQIVFNFQLMMKDENKSVLADRILHVDLLQLPKFFGVAVYAFEGIGVIFSIRSAMQKPECFPQVIRLQMFIIGLLYAGFAATSVMAFENGKLPEIILFTQPADNSFYMAVQSLYVGSALLTYPLALFPALNVIEKSSFLKQKLFTEDGKRQNPIMTYGLRVIMAILMLLIAIFVTSFSSFINLLGSCVFVYCGFLLPVILYHKHFKGKISTLTWAANVFTFVLSGILGAIGTVLSLMSLIKGEGSH